MGGTTGVRFLAGAIIRFFFSSPPHPDQLWGPPSLVSKDDGRGATGRAKANTGNIFNILLKCCAITHDVVPSSHKEFPYFAHTAALSMHPSIYNLVQLVINQKGGDKKCITLPP
jgi:hypothetical protein